MASENEPHLSEADKANIRAILKGQLDGDEALKIAEEYARLATENFKLRSELLHIEALLDRATVPYEPGKAAE